jgi:EpsI family protein
MTSRIGTRPSNRPGWIVAALFVGTFVVSQVARPVAAPQTIALARIPMTLASWTGSDAPPLDAATARVLGADQYVHRVYAQQGAPTIEMDVAYYAQPRVGATAHSPLNCLPGNGWTMSEPALREVVTGGRSWTVREVVVSRGTARWAMNYWFQNRQRVDYNEFAARWHVFTDALRRRPSDTAMVRVMTPVSTDEAAGRAAVAAFAGTLIPQVDRALATAR